MKNLFSLFVPLMALFLFTLQSKAETYVRIEETAMSGQYIYTNMSFVGNWTSTDLANLNLYTRTVSLKAKVSGTDLGTWTKVTSFSQSEPNSANGKLAAISPNMLQQAAGKQYARDYYCEPTQELLDKIGPDFYFQLTFYASSGNGIKVKISGNLMALLYGKDADVNPETKTTITNKYCFYRLFSDKDGKKGNSPKSYTLDCSALTLPATTLSESCYKEMFVEVATGLVNPPANLPALNLQQHCYDGMFKGCTRLTSSPKIHAYNIQSCGDNVTSACKEMFSGCTSMTTLTTNFINWSNIEGSNSPTYNWLKDCSQAITVNCPSTLTETKDASHMGTSGTKSAIAANQEPNVYVFNVSENSGTWDGTCAANYYYTSGALSVPTPNGGSSGWYDAPSGGSSITPSSLSAPSGITTYYAQFGSSSHTVMLEIDETDNYGTIDRSSIADVEDATSISINGNELTIGNDTVTATPTTSDGDYTYTFSAWKNGATTLTGSSNTVTDDMTITAHFSRTNTPYTLTWIVDGEEVTTAGITRGSVAWGSNINKPANPTKSFYTFAGWDANNDGVADEASTTMPKANTTYTALWAIANPLVLSDNGNTAYYTAYDALDGTEKVNVRIERSINANTWSTICLPFDVDMETIDNADYEGKFYKFMGATGDYRGIDLHFSPAGYVDANTPYLFRSGEKVTQLDFANVTLQKREENEISETGNVKFIGTIAPKTLKDDGVHTILGLYENRIYYPNTSSGTYIRAFRGYFTVGASAGSVQPRVRIVVQDNKATPIEVIELSNGETETEVRKYVEDGVMIIEKNGVRYSVTGQEMK